MNSAILQRMVVRADDTRESLMRKARLATILGTWQSTLTDFRYLSSSWKKNCEDERLLGVSMTGIMDCELTNGKEAGLETCFMIYDKRLSKTNRKFAKNIGVEQSVATTCVKPSGTVSQLVDAASGIHARHNPHYIRTVERTIKIRCVLS